MMQVAVSSRRDRAALTARLNRQVKPRLEKIDGVAGVEAVSYTHLDVYKRQVHAGASGCAASALVVYGYLFKKLLDGKYNKILLAATGALHSPTSNQQGDNIPTIAHAVSLEMV